MLTSPLYKRFSADRYVCYDPVTGSYAVVAAERVPPLVPLPGRVQRALRLSQAAGPPAPRGDGGRKSRALLLMAMLEFQRRAHAVGMPEAAQPYLDHLAGLAADKGAAKQAIRLSLQAGAEPHDPAPYGYCPECRQPFTNVERAKDGNAGCANGHTVPAKRAKYSFTGVPITGEAAGRLLDLGKTVRDDDLAEDGRETEPHVTIRYGLHTARAEDVLPVLEKAGPVRMWLGRVSVFRGAETGAPFDVLKVDVDSPDLRRLNAALGRLPHTDTHPVYQPHATIAYVNAGLGDEYAAQMPPLDLDVTEHECEFSSPAREQTAIRLSWQAVPYTDGKTRRYQFKAVGDGPDAGRVLYGPDAQRAITAQQNRGRQAQQHDQRTATTTGDVAPGGQQHPEQGYSHKEYRAKAAEAYKAASAVAAAAVGREPITADHLRGLAQHLPYLTVAQLRSVRARLNTAFDVSFGGARRRAAMVDSVMDHVRRELDRLDQEQGKPAAVTPPAGEAQAEGAVAAEPAAAEPSNPVTEPPPEQEPAAPPAEPGPVLQANGRPAVFKPRPGAEPNAALPDESRPALTDQQKAAVQQYTYGRYKELNEALKTTGAVPPHLAALDRELRGAFAVAKPFAEPVTVYRGQKSRSAGRTVAQLDKLKKGLATGEPVTLAGYVSTGTDANTPLLFKGPLVYQIEATRGLDLKPYSYRPEEQELLLDHDGRYQVTGIDQHGDRHLVRLRQLSVGGAASEAVTTHADTTPSQEPKVREEPVVSPPPPPPKANDFRAALAPDATPAAPTAPATSIADVVKAGDWDVLAARVKTGKDKDELVAAVRQQHGEDAAKNLVRLPPAKAAQWVRDHLKPTAR